jgi:uncharacterized paraquat-inducible protein A
MSWAQGTFVDDLLKQIHKYASDNREILSKSRLCHCFGCESKFKFTSIKKWIHKDNTAVCPRCGIDAVVPAEVSIKLTRNILVKMNEYFFRQYDEF